MFFRILLLKKNGICAILFEYTIGKDRSQMTIKSFIKKLLVRSCVYFTVSMLVYMILAAIVNVGESDLLLDAGRCVLFFVFSLLLAGANTVFSIKSLSPALRVIIHYAFTLFGFYVCFIMTLGMRAAQIFIGLVAFTVVYFIILGTVAVFKSKYRRNAELSEKYQDQYKKQSKK